MLDFVLWAFAVLTAWVFLLACVKKDPWVRPRVRGAVLLSVSGKIKGPNKKDFDYNADTFFKKKDLFFPSAVEYDFESLNCFVFKKVKFVCGGEEVTYEGPELRDVLADAASEYKFASVHGLSKVLPLWKAAIQSETWILAVRRNCRGMTNGEFGPLLLVYHPGGKDVAPEDRSRWVTGVYHIETK